VFTRPRIISADTVSPECDGNLSINYGKLFLLAESITDLLIVAYVAFRLIQHIRRSNIPLFSKLVIWNSLRISIVLINIGIGIIIPNNQPASHITQTVIFIVLSYVITFDVGKSDNPISEGGLESGNRKETSTTSSSNSETSFSSEDIILRTSNGMSVDMPLKNVRDEIQMEQQYNIESIEQNGDVIVSVQSLSFYEVASMFLGKNK